MKHGSNKVGLVATSALAGLLLTGCPWDSPETHLARGKEMAAKQQHSDAVIEFKNYLQTNPKSVEGRFLLGREYLAQGNTKASSIELQKAYDGNYARKAVVPLLARCQFLLGEYDKIAAEVNKPELDSAAANASLYGTYGSALAAQGKLDDALAAFHKAQEYVQGYPYAMIGEAAIKANRGDLDGASAAVAQVLAADAGQIEALILKGDIARTREQMPAAIEAYLDATTRAPRNVTARVDLAASYIATKAYDLAQKQVTELKRLAPGSADVNYQDALLAFLAKDYPRAAEAARLTLAESPGNGTAEILAGAIAIANNQPEQAELHLKEGLRIIPRSLFARGLLTRIYLARREPLKADEVLRPAVIALPDNPIFVTLAGEVALQKGDFAEASKLLAKAGELDPKNAQVGVESAGAEFAKGDEMQGFAVLEATAKATENKPLPLTALVLARLEHRQYDQALESWNALHAELPNDPVTYNLRAAIDLGRKDQPAARKALERALELLPTYFPAVTNLAAMDEQAGDIESARGRYRSLLAKDKNNSPGYLALAQLETRYGAKSDVVLPLLNEARRSSPTSEQPVTTLANYYASLNQLQQAVNILQEGLARTPDNVNILSLLGRVQLSMGNVDQAIAAYRKLVAIRPNAVDFQVGLGLAMLAAKQVGPATDVFSAALQANPDAYDAQLAAVDALLNADKPEQANRLIAEIRKARPKAPALAELDADAKLATRQFADAATAYRRILAQTPSTKFVLKLYAAVQKSGNAQGASTVLSDWLKAHPDDVAVRIVDAEAALKANEFAHAAQNYREILKTRPNDPATLNNLAWTLLQQKDPQALDIARRASSVAPNDPSVNDTIGWILVEQGKAKEGLEFLQRAAASSPTQRSIALHLAKAQMKDGRRDDARATLQTLVKNAPDSPEGKESRTLIATINAAGR